MPVLTGFQKKKIIGNAWRKENYVFDSELPSWQEYLIGKIMAWIVSFCTITLLPFIVNNTNERNFYFSIFFNDFVNMLVVRWCFLRTVLFNNSLFILF